MADKSIAELVDWGKATPEKGGGSIVEVTVGLRLKRDGRIDFYANADAIKEARDIPEFLEQAAKILRENLRGGRARTGA